jgi:hypothetical protein
MRPDSVTLFRQNIPTRVTVSLNPVRNNMVSFERWRDLSRNQTDVVEVFHVKDLKINA